MQALDAPGSSCQTGMLCMYSTTLGRDAQNWSTSAAAELSGCQPCHEAGVQQVSERGHHIWDPESNRLVSKDSQLQPSRHPVFQDDAHKVWQASKCLPKT